MNASYSTPHAHTHMHKEDNRLIEQKFYHLHVFYHRQEFNEHQIKFIYDKNGMHKEFEW